jgi:hypothetical protein
VENGPETGFRQGGREGERTGSQKYGDLGRQDGDDHLCDKEKRRDACEQSEQKEEAAEDLRNRNEMGCQFRQGEAEFSKASDTLVRVNEFQQAFPEKDATGE